MLFAFLLPCQVTSRPLFEEAILTYPDLKCLSCLTALLVLQVPPSDRPAMLDVESLKGLRETAKALLPQETVGAIDQDDGCCWLDWDDVHGHD